MPIFDCTPDGGGSASAGVTSFNGRTGAVTPQEGDYTAEQVNARPDNWMPTAGDGVSVSGETMSVRVSNQADNATGILNGALYTPIPRPSALYPLVEVSVIPATAGVQVTATKGDLSVQGTTDENGKVDIEVSAFGVWNFSATIGGKQVSEDISINASQLYTLTLTAINVFGVSWDKTNSSTQLTRLTPENDPNGFVTREIVEEPSPAVGTGEGSSPFDNYAPWNGMYVCNLNASGVETAKQGDTGFSYSNADVMVWIPEFYYRCVQNGDTQLFYVGDQMFDGAEKHPGSGRYVSRYTPGEGYRSVSGVEPLTGITRAQARTGITGKGQNWFQYDFTTYSAIIFLYLVEFADWNSQSVVGRGIVSTNAQNNGGTDGMIYHTGRAAGEDGYTAVQYRGIENLWGNIEQFVDGANRFGSVMYVCTNPDYYADDTTTNYSNPGIVLGNSGYIKQIGFNESYMWVFIPSEAGGSETTYIPDYMYSSVLGDYSTLSVGGISSNGYYAGILFFSCNSSSTGTAASKGTRIIQIPQEVQQ